MATILKPKLWLNITLVWVVLAAAVYGTFMWTIFRAYSLAGDKTATVGDADRLVTISRFLMPALMASIVGVLGSAFMLVLSLLNKRK